MLNLTVEAIEEMACKILDEIATLKVLLNPANPQLQICAEVEPEQPILSIGCTIMRADGTIQEVEKPIKIIKKSKK